LREAKTLRTTSAFLVSNPPRLARREVNDRIWAVGGGRFRYAVSFSE